jgi:hypothetical protein
MRQLDDLIKPYSRTLIDKAFITIFKDIFDERMKSYYGRAKAPVCKYWGFEGDNRGGGFSIYVDDGADTPKSAIEFTFSTVKGVVNPSGEISPEAVKEV